MAAVDQATARGGDLPAVVVETGALSQRTGRAAELLDGNRTDAVAVPVAPAGVADAGDLQPRPGTADAATRYGVDLFDWAQREHLHGTAGEAAVLHLPRVLAGRDDPAWAGLPARLVLVGVGDGGPTDLRHAGAALARATAGLGQVVTTIASEAPEDAARAFIEGFLLAAYQPPRAGAVGGERPGTRRLVLLGRTPESVISAARASARAAWLARRLAATPSNTKTPAWLAAQILDAAALVPGTTAAVYDETWLDEAGLGGVLAVGGGSAHPPRLVVVDHRPVAVTPVTRHVVLVGKGITFDSGGLSIKNRDAMVPMKTDMSGAAAAVAAMLGAAESGTPHRVTAVVPLAENAVGARSYRPGDVLRLADGATVEVRNTDAEGRLVLADALAWAADNLDPDIVVDIATLTGAATLGLGQRHAALYTADDGLAAGLTAAGDACGEAVWRMPLVEEYRQALDSPVADLANIATDAHVHGGSIIAALFLQHFARDRTWAHLDIAGPARRAKAEHEVTEGPSGFGARLLLRWLEGLS